MGAAQVDNLRCHISGPQKNALGWLGPNGVVGAAGETGTYRIYASDVAGPAPASVSPRLLRVQRNAKEIYWVEFRQLFPEDAYLTNSVRLLRSFSKGPVVYSLDATGDSPLGRADGGIMLGKTYEDAQAGVYITPIGKGGTQPESVDVVVKRGKFSGNRAPVLKTKSRVIETTKDEIVSFQVEASDPDGDELQYAWDFGDQRFDWAKPKVTHRWPNDENRQFVVRCVVTDMKGGTASVSWPVAVGKPKNGWIAAW
jgi:hypothetical protein